MNDYKLSRKLLSPVWTHLTDLIVTRAEGCKLYTQDGREMLDFTSGFGVTSTGHCHPKVVKAIQEQASKLIHGQLNLIYHPSILEMVEKLRTILPSSLNRYFVSNSGAEAVEAAVKLARHASHKSNLIVFQNGFHGRTAMTMSLTSSKSRYREGYQPLLPGVFFAPYPYSYFYQWREEDTVRWCVEQLRHILNTQTAPEETAAILIEPILGEGGVVPAHPSFLRELRDLCTEFNILLICDEIQCGFGRSGKLFAYEYASIVPDILIMGKGIASGMPISIMAAHESLMEHWLLGSHGGTYNGNPICAAAALATIDVLEEENLTARSAELGEYLFGKLEQVRKDANVNGEVRGRGLMVGFELSDSGGKPDIHLTKKIQKKCLDKGLLVVTSGSYGNVFRFLPPLVISKDELDTGLDIFAESLQETIV